eukprot:1627885-Amphidinium_carterae.1
MVRRGIALAAFNLLPFDAHSKWVDWLVQQTGRPCRDTHLHVGVPELIEADRFLWMRIINLTSSGIAVGTD